MVYKGVDSGIERLSKILMPVLLVLILGIACFSLTLNRTDESGVTRTGLQGLLVYVVPNFEGMTLRKFLVVLTDAMGQLFYSISVAMGIMVTYGSYVKKETNLVKSVNQIEIFDTAVAFLAGMMIIPAVFTFMGTDGMYASGPSLMFQSLPKVFGAIDKFHVSRKKACIVITLIALVMGLAVCLGYNMLYFEAILPNTPVGKNAQILDVLDYISNYVLMPVVSIATRIFIGWVVKPKTIIDEVTLGGCKFRREKLYVVMVKIVTPLPLFFLLLQSLGIIRF